MTTACHRKSRKSNRQKQKNELIQPAQPERIKITWHLDSIPDTVRVSEYLNKFSPEQQEVLFAVNRINKSRLRKGNTLVVPDTFLTDLRHYAPFPSVISFADTLPKTILISLRVQAIGMYEYGKLVRWGPISSGKKSTQTPTGLYYTNWKSKRKISTVDEEWIMPWYFNISNLGGIGLHEYELPGFPASHSCVRLQQKDAKWIYYWAERWTLAEGGMKKLTNGTPVLIIGIYNYDAEVPWRQLINNPSSNDLSDDELKELKHQRSQVRKYLTVNESVE